MVTASSAQREPSMEEILASIRRIIEDNDSGRKPGDEESVRVDAAATERTVIEVDAFRNELRSPPVELRTPPVQAVESASSPRDVPEKKPVTLAEVQAQIAAETRFPPAPRWSQEKPPAPERSAAEERIQMAIDRARAASADSARAPFHDAANVAVAFDERAPEPAPAPEKIEVEPKRVAASVLATNRAVIAESTAAKPAILSERAERKVAASFGELSEAFAARSKKTFDEMAEEMIRPMLQDWLDNNLPILVERLVREEIERVARGAQ